MKKRDSSFSLPIFIIVLCLVFNLAAWKSAAFSDYYVTNIFPAITSMYGRVTSLVSFSVGEVMLVFVIIFLVFTVIFVLQHTGFLIFLRLTKASGNKISKLEKSARRVSDFLNKATTVLLTITILVMSLNCFVLYHCSKLKVQPDTGETKSYSLEELTILRDYVVRTCNEMSLQVPHDENGNVVFEGNMQETAIRAMRNISDDYPRLSGYYVTPKALYFSDFMCQQYMQGYYFPFSMEANYNDTMNMLNKPFTMCHELAHTHGYIYEDEANFFGFLACINSDDIVFRYSGFLGILNYVNNDFYNAVSKEEYQSHVGISARVKYDNQFLSPEGWEEVEKNAVLKTETVKKAADAFIDTNLKVNGVSSGKVSYAHVVGLIMDYYDKNSLFMNIE